MIANTHLFDCEFSVNGEINLLIVLNIEQPLSVCCYLKIT